MPYYAVKVGRKPGVYQSWDECKKQTDGFSGAVYKKFNNYPDAYCFVNNFMLDSSKLSKEQLENLPSVLSSSDEIIIVDPDEEYKKLEPKLDGEAGNTGKNITNFNKNTVSLYTDGACSGNPGKGGYGYAVVIGDSLTLQGSGGLLATTNNQMELTAVIEGLKVIPDDYVVTVYSDSSYVVNTFQKDWISGWQRRNWIKSDGVPVANRELWEELLMIIERHPSVSFVWVKGHAGNKFNEICDRLAVSAIRDLH